MTGDGTTLARSTAEEVAAAALAEAGETVVGMSTLAIEPRGAASVTAVAAALGGDATDASRVVYVDESVDPAAIWVHPDDPHLPALAAAAFPHAVGVLLARLGVPGAVESVELVAYRPTRRAVIRVGVGGSAVYVKIVRPDLVERIAGRHRAFAAAGVPVPPVLGWSPAGLLVLAAADGTPLDAVVAEADAEALVRELGALRGRIAAIEGIPPSARPSVASRAGWYASRLAERMPRLSGRLGPLVSAARRAAAASVTPMTVHGDLHAGQLFVGDDGRSITGLVDVDTAASADPGIDSGAFVAHALASVVLAGRSGDVSRATGFRALAAAAEASWLGRPEGTDHAHAVGHLLAQAMQSAFARDDPDGAVGLVDAAERLAAPRHPAHEDPLTESSRPPHPPAGT
ncbi:phosphotransferase [Agromyces sp. ZXT2-6]|uniref:phosphotransferase n=1 Tax=Agromyces sp. ZXT2-6 TaxID=3461153 RepID=UPI004054E944